MQIHIEQPSSPGPLSIAGSISLHTAEAFHEALRQRVTSEASVTLDLTGVDECDLAGVQLLCSARKTAFEAGKPWKADLAPVIVNICESLGIPAGSISGDVRGAYE